MAQTESLSKEIARLRHFEICLNIAWKAIQMHVWSLFKFIGCLFNRYLRQFWFSRALISVSGIGAWLIKCKKVFASWGSSMKVLITIAGSSWTMLSQATLWLETSLETRWENSPKPSSLLILCPFCLAISQKFWTTKCQMYINPWKRPFKQFSTHFCWKIIGSGRDGWKCEEGWGTFEFATIANFEAPFSRYQVDSLLPSS